MARPDFGEPADTAKQAVKSVYRSIVDVILTGIVVKAVRIIITSTSQRGDPALASTATSRRRNSSRSATWPAMMAQRRRSAEE